MAATKKAVDFTNVKEVGNFQPRRMPAGDYRGRITKVDDHVKGEGKDRKEMWVFTIVPVSRPRNTYPMYCGFGENEAWKIRNLLIAAGFAVPKKRMGIDPNKLVGKEIGMSLDDDEYEGKSKSVIVATFPVDELSEDAPGGSDSDDADDEETEDVDEELELEEI
jgi:hypothetical protein